MVKRRANHGAAVGLALQGGAESHEASRCSRENHTNAVRPHVLEFLHLKRKSRDDVGGGEARQPFERSWVSVCRERGGEKEREKERDP